MFRTAFAILCWFAVVAPAMASPVATALPGAEQRGQATYRMLGFPIYHARLFTLGGEPFSWNEDVALELNYLKKLKQNDLIESTMREMKRLGDPLPIRSQLTNCFYDVKKGDRYLAVSSGPDRIRFWRNEQLTCTLSYPGIKQGFMAIFLGDNTRSPAFTRKLRGQ